MPTRRNVAAALALAFVCTGNAGAQPAVPSPALAEVRRELDAFRTELKRAAEQRDIARLRAMFADTFTHTHVSGRVEDKAAHIISLVAREPSIESGLVLDPVVNLYGSDTAILTARTPFLNRDDSKNYDFRWMQVFTRMSGQWQLAASQATMVQPEK
jgi:hypothetical protein